MVKDHSDSERGNPLPPHGLLFDWQQGLFYMHHPTDRITHTTAFVTPVVEHWLEREIAQWVHLMKDRSDDPPHHERTLYLWATSRSPPLMQSSPKHAVIGEQEVFSLSVAEYRQLFDKHTKCHNYAVEYYIIACVHLLRDSNVTGRKEGHVLFSERGNPTSSKGSFICTIPQTG